MKLQNQFIEEEKKSNLKTKSIKSQHFRSQSQNIRKNKVLIPEEPILKDKHLKQNEKINKKQKQNSINELISKILKGVDFESMENCVEEQQKHDIWNERELKNPAYNIDTQEKKDGIFNLDKENFEKFVKFLLDYQKKQRIKLKTKEISNFMENYITNEIKFTKIMNSLENISKIEKEKLKADLLRLSNLLSHFK